MFVPSIQESLTNAEFDWAQIRIEKNRTNLSLSGQFSSLSTVTFAPVWRGEGRPLAKLNGCHFHHS